MVNDQLMETALRAARAGASVLRGLWGRDLRIEHKESFDFVTNADQASEAAVLEVIRSAGPDHAIVAEESAGDWEKASSTPGVLWLVDPLDGTTNFMHGYPQVAVSVAALVDGVPHAGVVIDVTREEEFRALRGHGAWLGDRPLTVRDMPELSQALLLTGFPFRDKGRMDAYFELFKELFARISGMRRAGAAALDLAHVAAGRAQGFWEMGLKPWDLAAGILLVEEAGGRVTNFGGEDQIIWRGDVVAAAPGIHPWLQRTCASHFPRG